MKQNRLSMKREISILNEIKFLERKENKMHDRIKKLKKELRRN